MVKSSKAVFFDRDGVLNRPIIKNKKPYAPRNIDDFHIYVDVKWSVQKLIDEKFLIFVITNQPDVGNGLLKKKDLILMHDKLNSLVKINEIYVCMHSQIEKCVCRKPNTYFLIEAQKKYNINFENSFFVGDRFSDMITSKRVKMDSVFIDRNYKETPVMNSVVKVKGIKEATCHIMRNDK